MPDIDERLAQMFDVYALSAAGGIAPIGQKADIQRLGT